MLRLLLINAVFLGFNCIWLLVWAVLKSTKHKNYRAAFWGSISAWAAANADAAMLRNARLDLYRATQKARQETQGSEIPAWGA